MGSLKQAFDNLKGKSVVVYINKGKKYLSVDMLSSVDWGGKVNEKESFILNDSKNYFKLYESEKLLDFIFCYEISFLMNFLIFLNE